MQQMIEYYSSHIYFPIILVILLILAVVMCSKAFRAASLRNKESQALMKKLEEDTALRKEFEDLTLSKAQSADPEKLFRGVALGCCRDIEKAEDMMAVFNSFSEAKKRVYSLYFVFEDGSEKLSNFFVMNGKPLTEYAKQAVLEIYPEEISSIFCGEYLAYDEDDETTSLVKEQIEKEDEDFSKAISGVNMFAPAAQYIIENITDFS